jgi:hypothetical protein
LELFPKELNLWIWHLLTGFVYALENLDDGEIAIDFNQALGGGPEKGDIVLACRSRRSSRFKFIFQFAIQRVFTQGAAPNESVLDQGADSFAVLIIEKRPKEECLLFNIDRSKA